MSDSKRKSSRLRIKMKVGKLSSSVPAGKSVASPISDNPLFDKLYDGIVLSDRNGRILDANPRAGVLLRRPTEELPGQFIGDIIVGADASLVKKLLASLTTGRFALIEAYGLRPEKHPFPAEIAVSLLRSDPSILCFSLRDITRRRQTEASLRTGYTALQNAFNGIAVLDSDRRIRYANRAFYRLWGANEQTELLRRCFDELVTEPESIGTMLEKIRPKGGEWRNEVTARRLDGTTFPVFIGAAGNWDAEENWTGAVVSVTDITEAKRAAEAVREAEQRKAMLASLGAACHYMAQPATVILGNLGVLKQLSDQTPEDLRMLIDSSVEAAEELAQVLHKLNTMDQYKTVSYLEGEENTGLSGNQVLDI